jgi:ATP-dependent DNA ligase
MENSTKFVWFLGSIRTFEWQATSERMALETIESRNLRSFFSLLRRGHINGHRTKPSAAINRLPKSKPRKPRDPTQPSLPFDAMPDGIEPALALLKSRPPKGSAWTFEVKFDGYRLAVHIEPKSVCILTRGGHDWTHRFPKIAQAAAALGVSTALLDGEAVVLDNQGRSSSFSRS